MSSEESDTEDNSLRTRPLSWRTENVNNFFKLLDGRAKAAMTSQQRRQSVSRRQGVASERGTDTVPEHLKWAVCNSPQVILTVKVLSIDKVYLIHIKSRGVVKKHQKIV